MNAPITIITETKCPKLHIFLTPNTHPNGRIFMALGFTA
jgi:hypothetical protein